MVYKIRITPKHEREAQITRSCESSVERTTFHEYQNVPQQLPVVRLPIELPIYRMANGRTRTGQLKYIRQHQIAPHFFTAGQENQDPQQAQHDLLDKFSKEGTTSIEPIAKVLEGGRQTDPLLISSAGIVVNGNRRLAAMRELYATGEPAYQSFSHVNCTVLPASISEKEIKEIEVRLQMQPETKLPYTWVNEALTIKDLSLSGFSQDEIARDMRKQVRDVATALQALSHAEIYLKDWRREAEEYDIVEGAQQLFGDMARLLKDKTGDDLELSRRLGFLVQDNSKRMGSRAYNFNFSFGKKSPEVAEALAVRLGVDLTAAPDGEPTPDGDLPVDFEDENEGASYKPLIDLLDDPSRRNEIAEELIAVCDSIASAEQDQKRGQAALKAVKDANTRLLEVDLSTAETGSYAAIAAQLDSVIARALKLKDDVAKLTTPPVVAAKSED